MDSGPFDYAGTYRLSYTTSGEPFIALCTRSENPIFLTKYYAKDPSDVHAAISLPEVNPFLASTPTPYTLADAEGWVSSQLTAASNYPLQVLRTGAPDEAGTLIGSVSLMPHDNVALVDLRKKGLLTDSSRQEHECELGYYLHPDYRGKGIVKAGIRALLAYAQAEHGMNSVVVRVAEDNTASRRVIESMVEERWSRVEGKDLVVDWPDAKGGGKKKILCWMWMATSHGENKSESQNH